VSGRRFDVPCTVRVTNTPHELSAHVELPGGVELGPADRLRVHGDEINPSFGEVLVERRLATITRANWLERMWVRLTGDLGALELLDVSFTDRRTL